MKQIVFIIISILLFAHWTYANFASKVNKGNNLFEKEKYEDSLKKYTDAQLDNPESPILHYNMGNVYYKQGQYDKAIEELNKSLSSKENDLREKIYYNLGNTYFKKNDFMNAIEHYKKVLEINPDDEDAKYNIEITRKKMQENMQPQSGNQQQKQQQNQQQNKDQQSKNDNNPNKQKDKKKEQESENPQEKNKMSQEDAKRLLDALKDEENKTQKKLRPMQGGGVYIDKDW